jgi:hypothetical protein
MLRDLIQINFKINETIVGEEISDILVGLVVGGQAIDSFFYLMFVNFNKFDGLILLLEVLLVHLLNVFRMR